MMCVLRLAWRPAQILTTHIRTHERARARSHACMHMLPGAGSTRRRHCTAASSLQPFARSWWRSTAPCTNARAMPSNGDGAPSRVASGGEVAPDIAMFVEPAWDASRWGRAGSQLCYCCCYESMACADSAARADSIACDIPADWADPVACIARPAPTAWTSQTPWTAPIPWRHDPVADRNPMACANRMRWDGRRRGSHAGGGGADRR